MPKPTVSRQTARILSMLLRCGMICREELEVVLEMMEDRRGGYALRPASRSRRG